MEMIKRIHPSGMGMQRIYRFDNGYGASVIKTPFSYGGSQGLYELAVIKFNSNDMDDWRINYNTPVTGDVIGYLSEDKLQEVLKEIEALDKDAYYRRDDEREEE